MCFSLFSFLPSSSSNAKIGKRKPGARLWLTLALISAGIRSREAFAQHGTVGRPCEVSESQKTKKKTLWVCGTGKVRKFRSSGNHSWSDSKKRELWWRSFSDCSSSIIVKLIQWSTKLDSNPKIGFRLTEFWFLVPNNSGSIRKIIMKKTNLLGEHVQTTTNTN